MPENRLCQPVPPKDFAKETTLRLAFFGLSLLLVATTIAAAEHHFAAPGLVKLAFAAIRPFMNTTRTEGLRQSDRISVRIALEASWTDSTGIVQREVIETLLVSRNGGVIRLSEKFFPGQEISLRRPLEGDRIKTARARIVAEIDRESDGFLYAVHLIEPRSDFWDIEFPAPHKAEESLARLLMECSFCQRREVVYLNELELRSFETRKCVARICKACDAPSIWVEVQSETAATSAPTIRAMDDERVLPRRNRTRVKARVLACIRQRGFQEEVAVCEDLSKGGIAFRSRNQYAQGSRVEVAVPFTPGAGAIFVPIRIVFSQPIPSAGLYRHGAAYIKPPE